jgi:hypothetical protein
MKQNKKSSNSETSLVLVVDEETKLKGIRTGRNDEDDDIIFSNHSTMPRQFVYALRSRSSWEHRQIRKVFPIGRCNLPINIHDFQFSL